MMEEELVLETSTESVESDDRDLDYIITENDVQNQKDDKKDEEEFGKKQNVKVNN